MVVRCVVAHESVSAYDRGIRGMSAYGCAVLRMCTYDRANRGVNTYGSVI